MVRKEFNINFDTEQALFSFEAIEIFPASLDSTSNNIGFGSSLEFFFILNRYFKLKFD